MNKLLKSNSEILDEVANIGKEKISDGILNKQEAKDSKLYFQGKFKTTRKERSLAKKVIVKELSGEDSEEGKKPVDEGDCEEDGDYEMRYHASHDRPHNGVDVTGSKGNNPPAVRF